MEGRDVSKDRPAGRGRGRRGGVLWWKGVMCPRTGLQNEEEGGGVGFFGGRARRVKGQVCRTRKREGWGSLVEGRDVSKDRPAGRGRGRRGGVLWWKGVMCQRTGLQDEEEGGGVGFFGGRA